MEDFDLKSGSDGRGTEWVLREQMSMSGAILQMHWSIFARRNGWLAGVPRCRAILIYRRRLTTSWNVLLSAYIKYIICL
jgi:hypothetical protein